ncbi:MAG: hypothetical protein IK077_15405 [Thermoguttaceae bacterium]|nr:hypothetical protein [Thermoguttaceae bacterium]
MKKTPERAAIYKNSVVASSAMELLDNVDKTIEPVRFRFDPLYSGGPLYIDGWEVPVYVDLETLEIDPAPKALVEHDWDAVVGKLENVEVKNENGLFSLHAEAVVGGSSIAARVVDALAVCDWVSSLGVYRMDENKIEFLKKGESSNVNGREAFGPCAICHTGYLCEGSFVLCGGDGEASAVLASLTKNNHFIVNSNLGEQKMTFEEWLDAQGVDPSSLSEEEFADWQKKYEEQTATAEGEPIAEPTLEEIVVDAVETVAEELPAEDAEVVQDVASEIVEEIVEEIKDEFETAPVSAALKLTKIAKTKVAARVRANKAKGASRVNAAAALAENRRVGAIKALCDAYGKDGMKICAVAIDEGWTAQRARKVIEATLDRKKTIAGLRHPGVYSPDRLAADGPRPRDVLVASLAMTCGMKPDRVKAVCGFDDRVINAAMEKPNRNATLRTVVAASNNSIRPGSFGVNTSTLEAYRECKRNCESLTAAAKLPVSLGGLSAQAAFSTINAIDVFSAVLQAFLEPFGQTADPLWQTIAKTNTLADLNQVKSYSPTLLGRLTEISATGKIEHVGFKTTEFEQQAKANAATFVLPYMMIVNDQIDAFADLLQQFSELPNLCIEHDLAELIWRAVDGDLNAADGSAFCSTTRGNLYLTGANSVVGAATVTAMKAALDGMTNDAGVPLAPGGEILLVPTEHGPGALQMYHAEWIYDSDERTRNVWQDMFTPVVWQWLNPTVARTKKDDGSTASRFNTSGAFTPFMLLRDPQRRPAFCVNKVVGYESPVLDQFESPDEWGIAYRMIYPFSVSAKYADGLVVCAKS